MKLDSTNKVIASDSEAIHTKDSKMDCHDLDSNKSKSRNDNQNATTQDSITKWILANISFMLLVFSPLNVYVSGLYEFELDYMLPTILVLFGSFLLLYFSLIYLCSFFNGFRFYKFIVIFFNILLLVGFCYTFIFVGDYGLMSYFIFDRLPSVSEIQRVIDIFVIICCIVLGYFLLKFRFYINILKVLFIVMFCISSLNIYKVVEYIITHKNIESTPVIANDSEAIQKEDSNKIQNLDSKQSDPVFNFSTTQKNILVILLDNADGYFMKEHIESKKYDNLFNSFKGFRFYKNALSTSTFTLPTLTSVIAGKYYTAYNINHRQIDSVQEEIAKGFAMIFNAFYDSSFNIAAILDNPLDERYFKPLVKDSNNIIFNATKYENLYRQAHKDELKNLISNPIPLANLFSVSVFKFVPYSFRSSIYKGGAWLFNTRYAQVYSIAKMDAFQKLISNTQNKPTFKFFHFDVTHNPYFVDSNCKYVVTNKERDMMDAHKQTEICSLKILANVFEKMKKLDIYDNTQIFIVSDHGAMMQTFALPSKLNHAATLFYKPFNASDNLQIDSTNVVNYDIASIYCENISALSPCPNVDSNILENSRERKILTYKFVPQKDTPKGKIIKIDDYHIFKGGDIYDSKNWEVVKESDINKIQNLDSITFRF
ncbi:sulfatase-like hydrolase/transferase [Helicobacter saguini]|uniref:Sulfatase-like hydrolase/transferase n=1 Tax=Helicobacter saguini TaxID=1548018 RepID=A0A347VRZ3_9HELI|nr:sulfatase-like hydrolase/transferase [Helicobacter saguini]MWV62718.1 sulfatase-like hydrolase/transferase [Helicobacter saguini]MWV66611.1 sulfatase-like hydrolase/transferase [Helicobacter saguini]MWV68962.1 sulfatase-like hydrolase/transferase [Helicobacter saguini]MWV71485.1 sulfatase-like hydrolase/transferase [Helicobacter saguini]TLD94127.1 hypothetical protein LS64_007425 [Helicobacter saguini]